MKKVFYRKNKKDWYRPKSYPHFDLPFRKRKDAVDFVLNYKKGSSYGFYPLIQFDIEQKKYRTYKKLVGTHYIKVMDRENSKPKVRTINYPAHKDGYIFSFFAHELSKSYENVIKKLGLGDSISAYRSGIGSNIDIAGQAFKFIKEQKNCICIAYDIEKFFDSLDHSLLKKQLMNVLSVSKLSKAYYNIYKALTHYASIRKNDLPKGPDGELSRPVCDSKTLRKLKDKIYVHKKTYGIPQGTQISALFSNIYMIDFDVEISQKIKAQKGLYKRYADDILIIVPLTANIEELKKDIDNLVITALVEKAGGLKIQSKKTEKLVFKNGIVTEGSHNALQYLGLTYNGTKLLIRNSSISRYVRKMLGGVRRKIHLAKRAKTHNGIVFKTYLYHQYSHLGTRNFYNYVKNIDTKLCSVFSLELGCRHQVRNHMKILKKEISGVRTTRHHKNKIDFLH